MVAVHANKTSNFSENAHSETSEKYCTYGSWRQIFAIEFIEKIEIKWLLTFEAGIICSISEQQLVASFTFTKSNSGIIIVVAKRICPAVAVRSAALVGHWNTISKFAFPIGFSSNDGT